MIGLARSLLRKADHVAADPTLRSWLVERFLGRTAAMPASLRRTPPYLEGYVLDRRTTVTAELADLDVGAPIADLELALPGETVRIAPSDVASVFDRSYSDTETLLALHRFAWVPLAGSHIDAAWVGAVWRAWLDSYAQPDDSWAWHPYTAAERIINILAFAKNHGLPGPRARSLEVLAAHGPAIFERLEYFGDAQTGNHLANNGRGLYLAGVSLGCDDWTRVGLRILMEEAPRILGASGILREGSSHYHFLIARWYNEAWQAARAHGRDEERELGHIAHRARAILAHLLLPGGLPLIGDVSPDVPPAALMDWFRMLSLAADAASSEALTADGWTRYDGDDWHGLWFVPPGGWPPMPGHGHQDCGGFELHHGTTPIFCDLGRRSYGSSGDADIGAGSHNTLMIDGAPSYPLNRPYYAEDFRRRTSGPAPTLRRDRDSVVLDCPGFTRLRDVGVWQRAWRFEPDRVTIDDHVAGHGRHRITRFLHTTLPVAIEGNGLRVGDWHVAANAQGKVEPVQYWERYGAGRPASRLTFVAEATLPFASRIVVERR